MRVRFHIPPTSKKRHGWNRLVGQMKNALNCTLIIEIGCNPTQRSIGQSCASGSDDLV